MSTPFSRKWLVTYSISIAMVIFSCFQKSCFAKCCVWSTLNSAIASGKISSLSGSEFLSAPSQPPTDLCQSKTGYSWVSCNPGECMALNCVADGYSGIAFSIYGGFCGETSSTVAAMQSAAKTIAPSAACHPISPIEIETASSGSASPSVVTSSPSPVPPSLAPPSPAPGTIALQAPAPSPSMASSSTCEASCTAPQTCMTCKKAAANAGDISISSGQVKGTISAGVATSDQTSFCVDQTNPDLVSMYRKINACSVASGILKSSWLGTAILCTLICCFITISM
jgi:hypothetical protein